MAFKCFAVAYKNHNDLPGGTTLYLVRQLQMLHIPELVQIQLRQSLSMTKTGTSVFNFCILCSPILDFYIFIARNWHQLSVGHDQSRPRETCSFVHSRIMRSIFDQISDSVSVIQFIFLRQIIAFIHVPSFRLGWLRSYHTSAYGFCFENSI